MLLPSDSIKPCSTVWWRVLDDEWSSRVQQDVVASTPVSVVRRTLFGPRRAPRSSGGREQRS
jgi:hypothetical protein